MPSYTEDTVFNVANYLVWQVTEDEAHFLERVNLDAKAIIRYKSIKGDKRRVEWLAGRYVVGQILDDTDTLIVIDDCGKPHIKGSELYMSLSHSHGYVVGLVAPRLCGIDIQLMVPKITRIAHKFINQNERESITPANELAYLHIYWSAKEALYKAYGKRSLDFKKNILIEPLTSLEESGIFKGKIIKDDFEQKYTLQYDFIDEHVLVTAIETNI